MKGWGRKQGDVAGRAADVMAMETHRGDPRRDRTAPTLPRNRMPHGWDASKPLYAATVPGWGLQYRCEGRDERDEEIQDTSMEEADARGCRDLEGARWMWFGDAPHRPPKGPYRTDELLRKLDRKEAYLDQLVVEDKGRSPLPMFKLFVRLEEERWSRTRRDSSMERRERREPEERRSRWPRASSDPREERKRSRSRSRDRERHRHRESDIDRHRHRERERSNSSRRLSAEPDRRHPHEHVDQRWTPELKKERQEPEEDGEINRDQPYARADLVDKDLHQQVQVRLQTLMERIPVPCDPQQIVLEQISKGLARLEKYSDFDFQGSGYCEFAARGTKTSIREEKGLLASAGIVAPGLTPVIDKSGASTVEGTPGPPSATPGEGVQGTLIPDAELAMYKPDSESSSESEKSDVSWSERPSKGASAQGATPGGHRRMGDSQPRKDQLDSHTQSATPEKTRMEKRAEKAKKRQRLADLRGDPTMGEWFYFGWDLREHGPYQYVEVLDFVKGGTIPPGLSIHRKEDDLWLQVFSNTSPPSKEDLCLDMQEVLKVQESTKANKLEDIDEWFEREAQLAENGCVEEEAPRVRAPPQFKARYCGKLQELLLRACRRHFVERAIDRRLAKVRETLKQKSQVQRQTTPKAAGGQDKNVATLGKLPPLPRVKEENVQSTVGKTPPQTKVGEGSNSERGASGDAGAGSQGKIQALLKKEADLVAEELEPLVNNLSRADVNGFFQEPVTDDIAPDYASVIKEPMDFARIKDKLHKDMYPKGLKGLEAVRKDVTLMFRNCMVYNPESTEYHQEAKRLLRHAEAAFNRLEKKIQKDMLRYR